MTLNAIDPTTLSADPGAIGKLKFQAKTDPQGAVKAAAQQFEALFLNMLLKSMRETTTQDTPFDSEQTRLYQSMLDQQLAQTLATRGIGLADIMARQLARQSVVAPDAIEGAVGPQSNAAAGAASATRDFANRMWPHAVEAGRQTGIPAHFILAQAALESGWGRAEIRGQDGVPSRNLFGIKAGRGWTGAVVETPTTEYVNGVARKTTERFRAYGSYAEAFADYARLLRSQPRFAGVLRNGGDAAGFAVGLQQAGYATDPMYADKLLRIINGGVLRQSLLA